MHNRDYLQLFVNEPLQFPPGTIGYTRGDEDAPPTAPLRRNTDLLPGGYDLIVLTNLDPPAAERVARMVRAWLGSSDD